MHPVVCNRTGRRLSPRRVWGGAIRSAGWGVFIAAWTVLGAAPKPAKPGSLDAASVQTQAFLKDYCFACHGNGKKKGGLNLDDLGMAQIPASDHPVWEKVLRQLRSREMPPEDEKQPGLEAREQAIHWIQAQVFQADCDRPDPGRVTIRRLNRTEYNHTIRDLVGVDFRPADDFPSDDVGYGFDNIGDVLSVPPILLEKYMTAAEKVLDAAIVTEDWTVKKTVRVEPQDLESSGGGNFTGSGGFRQGREGDAFVRHRFPAEGEFVIRVRAYGEQAGPEVVRMAIKVGGEEVQRFEVAAVMANPETFEVRVKRPPGDAKVAAAYLNNYVNERATDPKQRDRNLVVEYVEIEGPYHAKPVPLPDSHRRIFFKQPGKKNHAGVAREIVGSFAKRAFRRPVAKAELDRLMKLYDLGRAQGENFEAAVRLSLHAVLVSPQFLFRGEMQPEPDNPDRTAPIDEFALASRLSYFLWGTMPDDELSALAERRKLRKNLPAQVARLLASPRSRALVDGFATQWLQIRNLKVASPDPDLFSEYDETLAEDMRRETELFFEHVMRENRSVLEFLDANYTFVTPRLARHYGLPPVPGEAFQKVSLEGTGRGGLMTQGSILTITSNPTRTSPVKRGKWILENLLGTPPPPPPPNVPELSEANEKVLSGTLRQRMEQHREDPNCATCHARMDPIGFGFENFDAIGAFRRKDGAFAIEAGGRLVTGEAFEGPAELRKILLSTKRDDFLRCLAERMLTFALGRGMEHYDRCAIDEIARKLNGQEYRFNVLVTAIVESVPFQMRRGEAKRLVSQP